MKIKKYIACLVLVFSVLCAASGLSLDKTHEAFKQPVMVCSEVGWES